MDNVLTVFLSIIVILISSIGIFTVIKLRNRKPSNKHYVADKFGEYGKQISEETEKIAKTKTISEHELARELAEENKKIALEVRSEGREYITQVISIMKQDIELARSVITSKIEVLDLKMQQRIEMNELELRNMKHDIARAQKALEFIQTMAYGPEAKSEPAYLLGEEETDVHKDEAGKGVFSERGVPNESIITDYDLEEEKKNKEKEE